MHDVYVFEDINILSLEAFNVQKGEFSYDYVNTINLKLKDEVKKEYLGQKVSNTLEYILHNLSNGEYILLSEYVIYIRVVMNNVVEIELIDVKSEDINQTDTGNIQIIYEKDFSYNSKVNYYKYRPKKVQVWHILLLLIVVNIAFSYYLKRPKKTDEANYEYIDLLTKNSDLNKEIQNYSKNLEILKSYSLNETSLKKCYAYLNLMYVLNKKFNANYLKIVISNNLYVESIFDDYKNYLKSKDYLKDYSIEIKNLSNLEIKGGKYIFFVFNLYD